MIRELTEPYTPDKILFRDFQIEKLKKSIQNFKQFGAAASLLFQGYTGSGKTSVLMKVLKEEGNGSYLFAVGSKNHTCHKLLKSIFDMNYSTLGKVLTEGIIKLKKEPKILIFDEINKLKNKNEIKLFFDCLNTINRETDCPFVVLTNIFGLNQLMAEDAKKTLNFEIVEFPSYSYEQLVAIFQERRETIKQNHNVEIPRLSIDSACDIAYRFGDASARQVRIIMQRCLMDNDWSEVKMHQIIEGILEENIINRIKNMPPRERDFLKTLSEIYFRKKNKDIFPLTISYDEIKNRTGLQKPTISERIDTFENDYGLIETTRTNTGRIGGNRRVIIFKENYLNKINEFLGYDISMTIQSQL